MANTVSIFAERIFDGQNFLDQARLTINDGIVSSIDSHVERQAADLYCRGLLAPGFIDLQVNGGGGILLNSTPSLSGIQTIMAAHIKFGTTAMFPTLITDTVEVMESAADAIAQAISESVPGIVGVHFEGPHLSVEKKGAHSAEYIRPISVREWNILERKDLGQIIVTLAPENVLPQDIAKMVELGIKVCLGHTNAKFETAQKAVIAGADGFTHLYNAMSPLAGREPGVVGCAFFNEHTACGLIADGHHVDYSSCQIALKAKGKGKLFLVTDAMPPVGTNEQAFEFFDREVTLSDGKLTSTTGELAGSVLDMATAVKNCHQYMHVSLDESIRMASLYPAQYANLVNEMGTLSIGSKANFVVLNHELSVEQTWIDGKKEFQQ
ncbi:N-acetylglucosamine-6-phosphate deacetylase [Thalassotalea sp. M1531]|uniref:N-acetylgalactosamine-6-phosphate deacetylase n=1 Tax=Thalassotalea algicola TaxID=2716224 RepID=A0A7Y0Q5Z9_9GAMM|nr:N-acetylglucosamine-6-phosphate deacetylase [Thalassotalea algicola]NMP30272.1 N-acetylglucosamine-6-phosphate deacetylase [Thalassotalea algicola]